MRPLIISIFAIFIFSQSHAGQGGDGQTRDYRKEIDAQIYAARDRAVARISKMSTELLNKILPLKSVNRERFVKILNALEINKTCDRIQGSADDYLILNYWPRAKSDRDISSQGKCVSDDQHKSIEGIEVLSRFIDGLINKSISESEIERQLIHETLHLFGYNQDEAWFYSGRLVLNPNRARELSTMAVAFSAVKCLGDLRSTSWLRRFDHINSDHVGHLEEYSNDERANDPALGEVSHPGMRAYMSIVLSYIATNKMTELEWLCIGTQSITYLNRFETPYLEGAIKFLNATPKNDFRDVFRLAVILESCAWKDSCKF